MREPRKIRAYHAPSGSVLVAEVYGETGTEPRRSFQIIPDGIAEVVVIREGVWQVSALSVSTVKNVRMPR